jgi:hypothetical protein
MIFGTSWIDQRTICTLSPLLNLIIYPHPSMGSETLTEGEVIRDIDAVREKSPSCP